MTHNVHHLIKISAILYYTQPSSTVIYVHLKNNNNFMIISNYNDILKILVSYKGYVKVIEPTDSSHCFSKSAKPIDSMDPNGPVFPGALMQAPHGKSLEYKY